MCYVFIDLRQFRAFGAFDSKDRRRSESIQSGNLDFLSGVGIHGGYRLLVDPIQDPDELGFQFNGLVVKGRGAVHQVDVLGELLWIPAFTYPLRLFVEAKFRGEKTGIGTIRISIATLLDVNQNNLPQVLRSKGEIPQLRPKYSYVAKIFSTSGFSKPAMDLALAHGVSLIDLDLVEFQPILKAIREFTERVLSDPAK